MGHTDSPITAHNAFVADRLRGLSPDRAFLFGASCAEREWAVYDRASVGKRWERRRDLRDALNAVWSWLSGESQRPQGLADRCDGAITAVADDIETDSDALGFDISSHYFHLLNVIEDDAPQHVHLCGRFPLELVHTLLCTVLDLDPASDEGKRVIGTHDLTRTEMSRQTRMLASLTTNRPLRDLVRSARAESESERLFGTLWFDE